MVLLQVQEHEARHKVPDEHLQLHEAVLALQAGYAGAYAQQEGPEGVCKEA